MPAIAIPAAIGLGGSVLNAITGHKAASSAENTLSAAANNASAASLQAGRDAAAGISDAAGAGTAELQASRDRAIRAAQEGTAAGNAQLQQTLEAQRGNLQPYQQAGQVGLSGLTELANNPQDFKFDRADFDADPGTEIAIREGLEAIQKTAAMRGLGPSSGGQLKAYGKFATDQVLKSYGDVYKRSENTFRGNQDARYRTLSALTGVGERAVAGLNDAEGVAGRGIAGNLTDLGALTGQYDANTAARTSDLGLRAATDTGRITTDATRDSNDALLQGANARASGTIGRARAVGGLISSASDIGVDAATQYYGGDRARDRRVASRLPAGVR